MILDAQFNKVYRFWEFCNITLSTDAIFLPLTRAWGGEGYDEAVGGGRVVTRAGRARINTRPIMQTYVGLEIIFFIWKRG